MQQIYIGHWRWLQEQGPSYKQQASSCKLQAASLTRNNYLKVLLHKPGQRVKNRFNRKV
tara:strand:+ start:398 stop:574 length:177 start_codon:yes stop_codon:yes gene_type:complete